MPYSNAFVQVNAQGHFGPDVNTPTEVWQAGFHVSSLNTGTFDPTKIAPFLTAIQGATSTFHASGSQAAGSSCWLDRLTGAIIGTDGLYVAGALQPTTVYTYATPVAGSGTSIHPWSQACVITLRSIRLRGPASHGRIYWPATSQNTVPATGRMDITTQNNRATVAQTWLNAVNAAALAQFGTGWNVSLMSKVGVGVQATVTKVGIGARMDTQESRERDLPEAHVFANLTTSTAVQADADEQLTDAIRQALDPDDPTP